MLNSEILSEVYNSIRQNRARTILAGFGVAWGIFILVILLGVGEGFQSGVTSLFSAFAQKSMSIYGDYTSVKYNNIKEGQLISFDSYYLQTLRRRYGEDITAISPEAYNSEAAVKFKNKTKTTTVQGVSSDYFKINLLKYDKGGRNFNIIDEQRGRNVAVLGDQIAKELFVNEEALNQFINIDGNLYRVVGVIKGNDMFGMQKRNAIYIPYSRFLINFNKHDEFNSFSLILNNNVNTFGFEKELRDYIAYKSGFDRNDRQAVYIYNFESETSTFESLFAGLKILIWGIGICFLLSGIVGICNIMLVIVKERTNEIGIRKAVGALPKSIIRLVLTESVIITFLSGLIGLLLGMGLLFLVNIVLASMVDETKTSLLTEVIFNFPATIFALVVIVISGILAGLFPAIRASKITPVNAIRYENRG